MKFRDAVLAMLLVLTGACASVERRSPEPDLTLDEAKTLIRSGAVAEIFQPHQGCVVLTLKNGRLHTFEQPYLDWVLEYVDEAGLRSAIPISME